jgi:hypothetical protein
MNKVWRMKINMSCDLSHDMLIFNSSRGSLLLVPLHSPRSTTSMVSFFWLWFQLYLWLFTDELYVHLVQTGHTASHSTKGMSRLGTTAKCHVTPNALEGQVAVNKYQDREWGLETHLRLESLVHFLLVLFILILLIVITFRLLVRESCWSRTTATTTTMGQTVWIKVPETSSVSWAVSKFFFLCFNLFY